MTPTRPGDVGPNEGGRGHGPQQAGFTLSRLTAGGNVLTLQLLFVVAALPVVTTLPAAAALQRSLHQLVRAEAPRPARLFVVNFRWALARWLVAGVAMPVLTALVLLAGLFWWSTTTPFRWAALVLVCLGAGLGLATYLSLLAASAAEPVQSSPSDCRRSAWQLLRSQPIGFAGAVALELLWLALATRFPTLLLVGSGLVPAAIVWRLTGSSSKHLQGHRGRRREPGALRADQELRPERVTSHG